MGSAFNKDNKIDIYMRTDKQYYVSGQNLQGEIYINAKQYRLYNRLVVRLLGQEYIAWEQGQGEDRRSNQSKYKSYQSSFTVRELQGNIDQGQYIFPFSLLLPAMMTGSFYQSASCYLKYTLRAQLIHPSNPNQNQYYQMFLNIIQPPRMPIGPIAITNAVQSKCCNCCINYGIVSISMKADKNFVVNGDSIRVSGIIDNSRGKQNINRCKLVLQQHRFMAVPQIQNSPLKQDNIDNSYNLNQINNTINKGSSRNFDFVCKIPEQITSYTAIGRIVARYFVLHMYTEYGCCANTAQAVLHVVLHSRTPKIVEKKEAPLPAMWNPRILPSVACNNMKPYSYNPLQNVPFLNMPTNQEVNMGVNDGNSYMPSHQQVYLNFNDSYVPPSSDQDFMHYQPVYYNPNMFTDAERQQQGYQPYFGNAN